MSAYIYIYIRQSEFCLNLTVGDISLEYTKLSEKRQEMISPGSLFVVFFSLVQSSHLFQTTL